MGQATGTRTSSVSNDNGTFGTEEGIFFQVSHRKMIN